MVALETRVPLDHTPITVKACRQSTIGPQHCLQHFPLPFASSLALPSICLQCCWFAWLFGSVGFVVLLHSYFVGACCCVVVVSLFRCVVLLGLLGIC